MSSKSRVSVSLGEVEDEEDVFVVACGDVGDTTSSCQVFFGVVAPCLGSMGPVGVIIFEEAGTEDWAMFRNTWMGRASKNSWASIKGVDVSSGLWG